jgi:transposase InsO family protein
MVWNEVCPLTEKMRFIAAWHEKEQNMTQLCQQFNISRKTGYKLIARYEEENIEGLKDRSRTPHNHPEQIDDLIVQIILKTKRRYPKWGPQKIKDWLDTEKSNQYWPAASTIGKIFKRNGLVEPRKRRHRTPLYTKPFINCVAPNMVWSADYKGQFQLGLGGKYCYPLTISDNYSRYLLGCKALYSTGIKETKQHFERVFKEHGLPTAIKTDNGKPFGSPGLGGLTQLTVWWIRLGIIPERIKPGHPEQNGRHERMHKTLKESTAKPPYLTLEQQQRAFNRFKKEYNYDRPHAALNKKRPADLYTCSQKMYPKKIAQLEYDYNQVVRKVGRSGEISWKGRRIFLSESLRGEYIALKEINDDIWQVYFSTMKLAALDYQKGKIIHPD